MKLNIEENKDELLNLLHSYCEDIELLADYMNSTDFWYAPCSKNHHLAIAGGLCYHSRKVAELLLKKVTYHSNDLNFEWGDDRELRKYKLAESAVIIGVCHDLCKVNFYHKSFNSRNSEVSYEIKDDMPLGHGEKSLYIASKLLSLTFEEAVCIRWHMGPYEKGALENKSFNDAYNKFPLLTLTMTSDLEQSMREKSMEVQKTNNWQHDPYETIAIPGPGKGKVCPSCKTRHRPGECKGE